MYLFILVVEYLYTMWMCIAVIGVIKYWTANSLVEGIGEISEEKEEGGGGSRAWGRRQEIWRKRKVQGRREVTPCGRMPINVNELM